MTGVNPTLFREYDIRGHADRDLDDRAAAAIGRAYGTWLVRAGGRRFALGRDCRLHSPRVAGAFAAGARAAGAEPLWIGEVPTPLLYYALFRLPVAGGVQVTASHNPAPDNGFKLCIGREALHGAEIQKLREMIEKDDFEAGSAGESREDGLIDRYIEEWKTQGQGLAGFELGMDCANGMAGAVAPRLFRELGVRIHGLYLEPDGRFPNHDADPTVEENLKDLKALVARERPRCAVAYDGDADRVVALDHQGRVLWGDELLTLFARDLLARGPATILCDVKCTDRLEEDVRARGGTLVMWKTGHSLIKAKMKETRAALAGEMSGHMFFQDGYLGYDDAIYASLRLVCILARTGKTIPELLAGLPPRVSTPEIRVACPEAEKFRIVADVASRLAARHPTLAIDGARYRIPGGWGLVRASNTSPVLVVRFEAEDAERLAEVRGILADELARHGLAIP